MQARQVVVQIAAGTTITPCLRVIAAGVVVITCWRRGSKGTARTLLALPLGGLGRALRLIRAALNGLLLPLFGLSVGLLVLLVIQLVGGLVDDSRRRADADTQRRSSDEHTQNIAEFRSHGTHLTE